MQIPQSQILTTRHLNRVFDKTVATYKFYWFLGILDLFVKQGKTKMNVWEIMISMVANAWYPVNYFRLSFGKSESLYEAILALQRENNIPINIGIKDLIILLQALTQRPEIRKQLNFLQLNVPFRFLRPWIDTSDDREMVKRSQTFENGCLYKLEKENGEVASVETLKEVIRVKYQDGEDVYFKKHEAKDVVVIKDAVVDDEKLDVDSAEDLEELRMLERMERDDKKNTTQEDI